MEKLVNKVWMTLCIFLLLAVTGTAAEKTDWTIDPNHSSAQFAVTHLMVSTVRGEFGDLQGTVSIDEENLANSSVQVEIPSASIDTRNQRRNDHLKSADFFDAENFPKLTFKSKRVTVHDDGKLEIVGDLTIRDTTREVVLDAELTPTIQAFGGVRRGASATTTIDRHDFNVSWNRALDNGGVVVGNEVRITIDVELIQAKPAEDAESN